MDLESGGDGHLDVAKALKMSRGYTEKLDFVFQKNEFHIASKELSKNVQITVERKSIEDIVGVYGNPTVGE